MGTITTITILMVVIAIRVGIISTITITIIIAMDMGIIPTMDTFREMRMLAKISVFLLEKITLVWGAREQRLQSRESHSTKP